LGAVGVGSIFGRLVLAPLAGRVGLRRSFAVCLAGISTLMLLWLVLPLGQFWLLILFGTVFGLTFGGFSALCPVMMADYFGTRHIAGLIGIYYTGGGIGSLIGPWLAGAIFDWTGSYQPAIGIGAIAAGAAALTIFILEDARRTVVQPRLTG